MRQIILDTETTGLEPKHGHRIIEIGCVEVVNRRLTRRHYHQYINPQREIDAGAMEVHGISNEFLEDKPLFVDIVDDFLAFVEGAELVIHNAAFDIGFINHELKLLNKGLGKIEDRCTWLDTLAMARQKHPGQKNNLDALCRRYAVDNSQRDLHGALLDAEILADVFLIMTGGQTTLELRAENLTGGDNNAPPGSIVRVNSDRAALKIIRASEQELVSHQKKLEVVDKASGGQCLWSRVEVDG